MKKLFYLFLMFPLLFAACKEDEPTVKQLIFGTQYGMCNADCNYNFKLTDNKLFIDQNQSYGNGPFDFKQMGDSEFQKAKELLDMIPEELYSAEEVIGCPDCVDQGVIYIETTKNGEKYSWRVDTQEDQIPDYLQPFIKAVKETVTTLK